MVIVTISGKVKEIMDQFYAQNTPCLVTLVLDRIKIRSVTNYCEYYYTYLILHKMAPTVSRINIIYTRTCVSKLHFLDVQKQTLVLTKHIILVNDLNYN